MRRLIVARLLGNALRGQGGFRVNFHHGGVTPQSWCSHHSIVLRCHHRNSPRRSSRLFYDLVVGARMAWVAGCPWHGAPDPLAAERISGNQRICCWIVRMRAWASSCSLIALLAFSSASLKAAVSPVSSNSGSPSSSFQFHFP